LEKVKVIYATGFLYKNLGTRREEDLRPIPKIDTIHLLHFSNLINNLTKKSN